MGATAHATQVAMRDDSPIQQHAMLPAPDEDAFDGRTPSAGTAERLSSAGPHAATMDNRTSAPFGFAGIVPGKFTVDLGIPRPPATAGLAAIRPELRRDAAFAWVDHMLSSAHSNFGASRTAHPAMAFSHGGWMQPSYPQPSAAGSTRGHASWTGVTWAPQRPFRPRQMVPATERAAQQPADRLVDGYSSYQPDGTISALLRIMELVRTAMQSTIGTFGSGKAGPAAGEIVGSAQVAR